MSVKSRKLDVFQILNVASEPLSLKELLKKLGEKKSERTLRCYLAEMIQQGFVERLGNRKSTKYKMTSSRLGAAYSGSSFRFDEVCVRYRTQRRQIVRKVILGQLNKKDMSIEFAKIIPKIDPSLVIEDALEDLKYMDPIRIPAFGITIEDLNRWKESRKVQ
jgi:hypothetical protein